MVMVFSQQQKVTNTMGKCIEWDMMILVHGFGEKQGWMERFSTFVQYYTKFQQASWIP